MNQLIPLLARICSIVAVVSLVYFAPLTFAQKQLNEQVSESNNKIMSEYNDHKLDVVTIDFLNAIEDASTLYDSNYFSLSEEIGVRLRLRDAFEEYFATLVPLETKEGLEITQRSREVIQDMIAEFMESETQSMLATDIAQDLDAYSKVMTESLIHTSVAV